MTRGVFTDLVGRTFGQWVVTAYEGGSKWCCRCACGRESIVLGQSLRDGRTTRCFVCKNRVAPLTHGQSYTRIYRAWDAMKQRCENPNHPAFRHYGGRGIKVCKRWSESFEAFFRDVGHVPAGLSIDRYPNNNGNYEPGNVRDSV
jgi:hypothetical protein